MTASDNGMRTIKVYKVVVNMGVGEAGEKLLKAQRVLEMLTAHRSIQTLSKTTNKDLGVRVGMPIGCKVTLRGHDAEEFLERALWVKNNRLFNYSFDSEGNFSFGIPDYTDFPDMKYDPAIGVVGMDVSVVLKRPGARVAHRRIARSRVPASHRVGREEGMQFVIDRFKTEVLRG